MAALARLARVRPVRDAGAVLVRRLLAGRSLDEILHSNVLARAVRFPIPDRYVRIELPVGAPVWLHAQSAPYVYWAGFQTLEPETVPTFLQLARGAETIVDVGANFGAYSLLAARASPRATIVAFEPNPEVAAILTETIARNRVPVRVVRKALGDSPGRAQLSLAGGLSSLVPERQNSGARTAEVEVSTLDDELPDGADLVKIDAEGAELLVLRGMSRMLRAHRPCVICEIAPENVAAAIDLLDEYDYRVLSLPDRTPASAGASDVNYLLEPR